MAKTYKNLWPKLVEYANLQEAFRKAARGKRKRKSVAAFEEELESNLLSLQFELEEGLYEPGAYLNFYIHDPKRRLISAAPFRDRVVHHALVNVIGPIYERKFIFDTYANRKGKGTHKALDRATYYMRHYEYVLPLDVQQYFPSIDHGLLLDILKKTIADEEVLHLCEQIIASGKDIHQDNYKMHYFPGDDLLARERPRGLPIGNLTSQFWANVYLNGLDHYIKRVLGCKAYLRYVDDMLLFNNDKQILHQWRAAIIEYAATLRITLHKQRALPSPTCCGIPFLGFQLFPEHRRLKRNKVIHARRRLKIRGQAYEAGEIPLQQAIASVRSWIAHAAHGDTWGLRGAILEEIVLKARSEGFSPPKTLDAKALTTSELSHIRALAKL